MTPEEEKLQKLIQLKRYETPPEGYFDDFLDEFQKRRAEEEKVAVVKSSGGRSEKVKSWIRAFGVDRLLLGGGIAYAALMLGLLFWPKAPEIREDFREPVIFFPRNEQVPFVTPRPPQEEARR